MDGRLRLEAAVGSFALWSAAGSLWLVSEFAAKIGCLEAIGKLQVESKGSYGGSRFQFRNSSLSPRGCKHARRNDPGRNGPQPTPVSSNRQRRSGPAIVHV